MRRTPLKTRRRRKTMLPHEIEAQRARLWRKQGGLCAHCKRRLSDSAYERPQMAHLIPNTIASRKKWGDAVIDSDENIVMVCCLAHNNAVQIGPARPLEQERIAERARRALADE